MLVRNLWKQHLKEIGRSSGWNSNYWGAWMDVLDLGIDVDDGRGGDIRVAEIENEENCEYIPMPTIESGMGLPLLAD